MKQALSPEALALLRAALAVPGATQASVAKKIGISGTAVCLGLAGTYGASTDRISQKIVIALGRVHCPHLDEELSNTQCHEFSTRAAPTSSPFVMRHWRACQTCPNRRTPCSKE